MMDETKAPPSVPVQHGADRRTQPRYRFTAEAEITDEKTGKLVHARIADISERGCHAETNAPLPLTTETKIVIRKGSDSFIARARVVNSSGTSLGLAFLDVAAGQLPVLEAWLGSSRERDWLTISRRRTQRVLVRVPVRVSAHSPVTRFQEETHTLAISAHGASLSLARPVSKGDRLQLLNTVTGDTAECIVAYLGQRQGGRMEIGVEFILPNPKFWRVAFPPKDWSQPLSGL